MDINLKYDATHFLFKKHHQKPGVDPFQRSRYRLAFFYSGLLMLFLMLFIVASYSAFYTIISKEQRQETLELATQVLQANQGRLPALLSAPSGEVKPPVLSTSNQEVLFCYLLAPSGTMRAGFAQNNQLEDAIVSTLRKWNPKDNEIRHMTISNPLGKDIFVEATGISLHEKGSYAGTLYLGRDLSFYNRVMSRLLAILLALSGIFLLLASVAGNYMARRAMIPIEETYKKQQDFIADASHELRTPLSVFQSSIDVLEMEEKEKLSPFSLEILQDMKDESHSMRKLVTDLLTLSHYDSHSYSLEFEAFDFLPVAQQVLRAAKSLGESKGIHLCMKAETSLMLHGDREKLKQLLYILLDNAIKYSKKDGLVMIILQSSQDKDHGSFEMQVKDQGIGISSTQCDRIFDRFYRASKDRSRQVGGAGLGLAIAKAIVEAHHGEISVTSTVGIGTEFFIRIPIEKTGI